ncbi:MAG TPA: L-histidine N(alpha)-methyltransferase [Pyrinomonadaceae bacterium]|nr:L-histidine N(alpha)-methyltransferase [Chloracidobacterium sp.]HBE82944.1 L-histidine N(alpha)-methyltransferase [Blastocatellia bacterium]HRJ87388.1 L-histidine N(alpha)-methyltransferase [Pyrinomonadaceae bacterium]HRK49877.1 L-histidine N(alpha)-methyltransferase [Pyrinomonadaceae bacterium]
MESCTSPELTKFAEDVLAGLTSTPKQLSSRYFYDDEGSRLFMEIMKLPEYYPTRAEFKIFEEQTDEICRAFTDGAIGIDLIELGAGDGAKTAVLIHHFLKEGIDFTYSPIDISQEANDALSTRFKTMFPDLKISPLTGDYFKVLGSLKNGSGRRKVLLFLGSNIGNFQQDKALGFFRELRAVMNANDRLFIGFDMQKDPRVIVAAYDDPEGVTAAFNLNLLSRINRELGADFDLSKFSHYAQYRPVECAARSFLISRERQTVTIKALNRSFDFDQWEPIFMEISQKYTRAMIEELSSDSGFEIEQEFHNPDDFYIDSLWRPM